MLFSLLALLFLSPVSLLFVVAAGIFVVLLLSKQEVGNKTIQKKGGQESGTTSGQNERGQLCFQM